MPFFKPILKSLTLLCGLLLLSACFEESIVIKVDKSGAGFVEHKSFNNVENLMGSMLAGLEDSLNDGESSSTPESKYNDEYFAAQASKMGGGVSVESWKLATNEKGFQGYEAIYAFADINELRVSTSPGDEDAKDESAPVDSSALEAEHYFTMSDGKLTIHTPEPETEENQVEMADQANDAMNEQMLDMMAGFLAGARVSVRVEGLDEIKSTNARHFTDNSVTVMDVRIDEMLRDKKLFSEAQNFNALGREEAQVLADQIDGLDVDTQAEIVLEF